MESHQEDASKERWIVSYADFITTLFALFVLLFSLSMSERKLHQGMVSVARELGARPVAGGLRPRLADSAMPRPKIERLRLSPDMIGLATALRGVLESHPDSGARLFVTPEGIVISLAAAKFFATGHAEINSERRALLVDIAHVLDGVPNFISVLGFADSVPIHNALYRDNWDLSAARAANVLRFLVANSKIAPQQFGLVGYGKYHPVADNKTDEGRALNRRVDILIHPSDWKPVGWASAETIRRAYARANGAADR